jgi:hypothetical protein
LGSSQLEEALGQGLHALRADRNHREVARILEMPVDADGQQGHGHLVALHDDRHGRGHHVGSVGTEQETHLIDVQQLGIDAGDVGGIALVVVKHQLHGPAEQAALGIDVVAPELDRRQKLLAVGRHAAGQRDAEANLDRIGRPDLAGARKQQSCGDHQHRE